MSQIAYFHLLRPRQWMKNLMIFFPPFLSGTLFQPGCLNRGVLPLLSFCLVSSATYLFNDLLDVEQDACHPVKMQRPLPSGRVSLPVVKGMLVLLALGGIALAVMVSPLFLLYLALYLAVSVAYSLRLKHLPIVDIFCIAFGFVLRLFAGGAAFVVLISNWLFLTVFLLAVFLSVGKRMGEKVQLGDLAGCHRPALAAYPEGFLEGAMYLSGAAVLVTYALYAMSTPLLVYTVPLCLFGLLHYLLRIKKGGDGDPTAALTQDRVLFLTGVCWVLLVGMAVYL